MTVSKVRLVFSPNKKRHVIRPVVFALNGDASASDVLSSLLKIASRKLCCKAKGVYLKDGTQLSASNVCEVLGTKGGGLGIIVTKKRGETVQSTPPPSPTPSPSLSPSLPRAISISRGSDHDRSLRLSLFREFELSFGKNVVDIIAAYARKTPTFSDEGAPATVSFHDKWSTVTRVVAPTRKSWKEKGSHKHSVLGWGLLSGGTHRLVFQIDRMSEAGFMGNRSSIGIVDPVRFSTKSNSYGIGDCSHSWGLCCDGMFRSRGRVIKLQDSQGRTPSWKEGDIVGILVNPSAGKLAFTVGRRQYRVKPGTVHFPNQLKFGVTFSHVGDSFRFLEWEEQENMQFCMPKQLRI